MVAIISAQPGVGKFHGCRLAVWRLAIRYSNQPQLRQSSRQETRSRGHMRARMVTVALSAAALVVLVRTTTGQVQPVPGPGSGVVTVQGEVDVRRLPLVEVGQRGDWKVSLASVADARVVSMPAVALARPAFVRSGARYDITW